MKKIKSILAICLTLCMILAVAACGGSTPPPPAGGNQPAQELDSYYIAYALLGTDWILNYMEQRGAWGVKHAGNNTYDYFSSDFAAEKMESGQQNMINAGVDGLMAYAAYPTLTPTLVRMAEEARVPFIFHDMVILPELIDSVRANPYFGGFLGSNAYANGYQLGELAAQMGFKNALATGGHVGDPCHDARINGFRDAFEKGGGTLLGEQRNTSPAEMVQKSTDILNAFPQADVFYAATGVYISGAMTAAEALGRFDDLFFMTDDVNTDLCGFIRDGIMAGVGGAVVATTLSAALLQNKLDGHPILAADGLPIYDQETIRNMLVTKDNVDEFEHYILLNEILTEDFFKQFVWRYNPDVTAQTYIDFMKVYDLEWVKNLHS